MSVYSPVGRGRQLMPTPVSRKLIKEIYDRGSESQNARHTVPTLVLPQSVGLPTDYV